MKFKHWFIIILVQILLVAGGLFLYHLMLGGTGIDPGDAITLWATVITIVFIVFSVLGILDIQSRMNTLKESEKDYMQLQEKTNEIISTFDSLREELVKKAQGEIQKIIRNSAELQNYYGLFAAVEAVPAPDRRIAMYTDIIANTRPIDGLDKAFPYIKRGAAYMQLRLLDKAKADFDFALANCTPMNKSAAYGCLGDYYVQVKDFKKAADFFAKALAEKPSSAPLCTDLANAYAAQGEFDKAKEYYDRALSINPESAEIFYNKAKRLYDIKPNRADADDEQIIAYLDKSISLNPLFFKSYINKASVLRSQGKESDATDVLEQIVKPMFDHDFIMGIEQRGITYKMTRDLPKALNDFNFVLFHDPHNVQNLCNLALVSLEMNNLSNADYYSRIGLQEAERQNNHACDGDFYMVRQMLLNIQNHMQFSSPFRPVSEPDHKSNNE